MMKRVIRCFCPACASWILPSWTVGSRRPLRHHLPSMGMADSQVQHAELALGRIEFDARTDRSVLGSLNQMRFLLDGRVNKGDFSFAMAAQIPKLMDQFEKDPLAKYTPCNFPDRNEIVKALAEVHTELVLIHPVREGNGRCSRILTSLMALQAGLPVLDFSVISGSRKSEYFAAVQLGMDRDYTPMEKLFAEIIECSIRALSE